MPVIDKLIGLAIALVVGIVCYYFFEKRGKKNKKTT